MLSVKADLALQAWCTQYICTNRNVRYTSTSALFTLFLQEHRSNVGVFSFVYSCKLGTPGTVLVLEQYSLTWFDSKANTYCCSFPGPPSPFPYLSLSLSPYSSRRRFDLHGRLLITAIRLPPPYFPPSSPLFISLSVIYIVVILNHSRVAVVTVVVAMINH